MTTSKRKVKKDKDPTYTGGRKGLYHEWISKEGLVKLEGYARDGKTDKQIAEMIGISTVTLYDWKNRFPNFANALKLGKEVVDRQVESALLQKALGNATSEEILYSVDEYGNQIEERRIVKKAAPDTASAIFWLKNRKSDVWKDRIQNEHNVQIEEISAEERRQRIEALQKRLEG